MEEEEIMWHSPFEIEPSEEFKKRHPNLNALKYTDIFGRSSFVAIEKNAPREALTEATKKLLRR